MCNELFSPRQFNDAFTPELGKEGQTSQKYTQTVIYVTNIGKTAFDLSVK